MIFNEKYAVHAPTPIGIPMRVRDTQLCRFISSRWPCAHWESPISFYSINGIVREVYQTTVKAKEKVMNSQSEFGAFHSKITVHSNMRCFGPFSTSSTRMADLISVFLCMRNKFQWFLCVFHFRSAFCTLLPSFFVLPLLDGRWSCSANQPE